jgi:hypothetical protein
MPLALPPSPALPLAARPSSRPTYLQDYFGLDIPITPPLLTPAALLSCVVRLEAEGAEDPLVLPDGYDGPAGDDLVEQTQQTTKFAEWGQDGGSEQHEHDWTRLLTCYNPWTQPMIRRCVFTPGMVSGTWVGRMFVCLFSAYTVVALTSVFVKEIPRDRYDALLAPAHFATPPLVNVYPRPMQFHVR